MTKWEWSDLWWVASVTAGTIGMIYVCYIASGVFFVPRGSYIRPMGAALAVVVVALVLLLLGFLLGIVGLFRSSHKKMAIIGAILNLLPYPFFLCITKIGIVLGDLHLLK
jgi:hypothetical protein